MDSAERLRGKGQVCTLLQSSGEKRPPARRSDFLSKHSGLGVTAGGIASVDLHDCREYAAAPS